MRSMTKHMSAFWLLGCMLLATAEARAQCSFDESMPSEGEVLGQAPTLLTIKFLLGIHLQKVRLVGDDGTVWPLDWTGTEEDVFKAEFHPTTPLPPGKYRIEWIAYVRQHYHPDGGVIPFSIAVLGSAGASADATPAVAPPAGAAPRAAPGWPYRALRAMSAPPADH
jgi:methionine-rich copper-binding protein CopC